MILHPKPHRATTQSTNPNDGPQLDLRSSTSHQPNLHPLNPRGKTDRRSVGGCQSIVARMPRCGCGVSATPSTKLSRWLSVTSSAWICCFALVLLVWVGSVELGLVCFSWLLFSCCGLSSYLKLCTADFPMTFISKMMDMFYQLFRIH